MYVLECNDWSRIANVSDRASATVPVMPNDVWSSYVNRKGGWSRIDREGGTRGGRVLQRVQSRCSACRVGTRRGLQRVPSRCQAGAAARAESVPGGAAARAGSVQRVLSRCQAGAAAPAGSVQRVLSRCQAGAAAPAGSVPGGGCSACRVGARPGTARAESVPGGSSSTCRVGARRGFQRVQGRCQAGEAR